MNLSGRPEAVLTPEESQALRDGLTGQPVQIHNHFPETNPEIVSTIQARELTRELSRR